MPSTGRRSAAWALLPVVEAALPRVLRAAARGAAHPQTRATLAGAVVRSLARAEPPTPVLARLDRHPLAPAAVRVERSRSRGASASVDQMAVTMWFGEGPSLPPVISTGGTGRAVLRLGAGLLAAAAAGAVTAVAARGGGEPPRIVEHAPPRLEPPADTVGS